MRTNFRLFVFVSVLLFLSSGCFWRYSKVHQPDRMLAEKVYVERKINGDYLIKFPSVDSFTIYQGTSLESIDWKNSVANSKGNSIWFMDYDLSSRYFFGVENSAGERLIATERLIPIKGVSNFRDLGGIPTKDGRVIKWGKFYRSGKLNKMKNKDLDYFTTLGIKTVVDFRDDVEVEKDKSKLPTTYKINKVRVPIGDRSGNMQTQLKKKIRKADQKTFDSEGFVGDVMRQFIDTFAFHYQPFLDLAFEEENAPLLFHCTAGKDRTGLGAAILLAMLGVEKDVILDDFLMSNFYRNREINKTLRKTSLVGVRQRVAQPLVEVKESYLKIAFDAIDEKYGSMENFLEMEYGFNSLRLKQFRDKFLIPMEQF